jgi:hypothetical protein
MERQITITTENFESFLRCLSLFKEPVCNDVDIKNGIIRQRTNDRFAIFEIDLSSIISDISFPIVSLKNKFDSFKWFQGRDVSISVDDTSVIISDGTTDWKMEKPDASFMDNSFIDDNSFSNLFTLSEESLLLSYIMPKSLSDGMRIFTSAFNVNSVQMLFEDQLCSISAKTAAKTESVKFVGGITVEQPLNATTSIVVTPFISDHDGDANIRSYRIEDKICLTKFTMDISNIAINIFARSPLVIQE